ncbi:hypothetical protein CPT_Mano_015 [Achromobacter phage Mano]|uniref:Uncharacterized protein n=1 Tax=Achromobacter phage Mano TaxID=2767570 RepID=A0A7L8G8G7_9CAUD|nr:hypothetical protein KB680_gp15 [Achromobacter phage Mano]QOE32748.1 hypothetical protein CPT_Mano_015 [Achromobacter phage Mano]
MKYAYFNKADGKVLQWIDTEAMNYNLPDPELLHECTEDEWDMRGDGDRMALNGKIVPYVPPCI